ncbi:MAG: YfcC family protein [Bacteroidota bacterium]
MKKFPNAINIILGIIILAWLLTYLIPQGEYDRKLNEETDREEVVAGSYHQTDQDFLDVFQLLLAIPRGIESRAGLIVLILLSGGCFYVIEKTGALSEGLNKLVLTLEGKESMALVIVSLLFTAAGVAIGLQEEIIAMIPVLLLFGRKLGYNAFTVIYMSFGSAVLGSAFSPSNPFAVLIAQKEAELPLLSGSVFRLVVLAIAFIIWMIYLIRYSKENRIAREISESDPNRNIPLDHKVILILLTLILGIEIYGIIFWSWGFQEMSACFFFLGFTSGIIGKLGINGTAEAYVAGFKEMIFACVIIGLASSISLILKEGSVIDTIVHGLFGPLKYLPPAASAVIMMVSQSFLHLPIASYSGQAILTMPILIPLSDLIGISRQTCVLAYQYGAVMMDVIIPTNGALMAILAVAAIPYNKWMKFVLKPMLIILILAAGVIILATLIHLK